MCLKYSSHAFLLFAFIPQIWSQDTSSEPKDIYAALGSSFELPCTDGRTKESEWRFNGSFLVSSPVLRLHNTSLDDQGSYTCHDSNGELVRKARLHLGYPPSIPEVHCWSPSYPLKAMCSWTLPQDPILPTHYISTYRRLEDIYPCQRHSEQDRQCVLGELELFSIVPYLVNITAVNALGSASRVLPVIFEDIEDNLGTLYNRGKQKSISEHTGCGTPKRTCLLRKTISGSTPVGCLRIQARQNLMIVKPDPPVNVKVTALPGRKLQVQWAPPPTWPDPVTFPLKYIVQFQWGNANAASVMGPIESESMIRSGLMPGRMYHIRVSAMDLLDQGQSSEWSDVVNITLPRR